MKETLLWIVQGLLVIFMAGGLSAIMGLFRKDEPWRKAGLWVMTVAGPAALATCWKMQELFRAEDAVFWARLMSGDSSIVFAVGSAALIAGSGIAVAALGLHKNALPLFSGAVFVAAMWYIVYLHPTPHYVPMEPWQDKLVWFILIVGGAGASALVFLFLKDKLQFLLIPAVVGAGALSVASAAMVASYEQARTPLDLEPLTAHERIKDMGCLSCHTVDGLGFEDPGGALESVASRTEDVVLAFMNSPDAQTAEELGIRENATGEMAGVILTPDEVRLLTDAMMELFEVQPMSGLGAGFERVEQVLEEKTCMACHTLNGEGAPGGGIGGALEASARLDREVLVDWLKEPTLEKAIEYEITATPTGAMASFALPEEDAIAVADWLKTLPPPQD